MPKLIVYSEMDCLNWLNRMGVKPDSFYMDAEQFANNLAVGDDQVVAVIFGGGVARREVLKICKSLQVRASSEDSDILGLYILTDRQLPNCEHYYLYDGCPWAVTECRKWVHGAVIKNIWSCMGYDNAEDTKVFESKALAKISDVVDDHVLRNMIEQPKALKPDLEGLYAGSCRNVQ